MKHVKGIELSLTHEDHSAQQFCSNKGQAELASTCHRLTRRSEVSPTRGSNLELKLAG